MAKTNRPRRPAPPPKPPEPPAQCTNDANWRRHCWHYYPRGFWPRVDDVLPYTLTCCDCGMEATTRSFNRQCGAHGPHRLGPAYESRQNVWKPSIRLLPRESAP